MEDPLFTSMPTDSDSWHALKLAIAKEALLSERRSRPNYRHDGGKGGLGGTA